MELITTQIKRLAADLNGDSSLTYWKDHLKDQYGLEVKIGEGVHDASWILREISFILRPIPEALIRACGVTSLILEYLGKSRPHYPNHGFYRPDNQSVTLNVDIFYNPDFPEDFYDKNSYFLSRGAQTIAHEFGHGFDSVHGDISLKEPWMKLSGWSKEFKPGLKRLVIDDPGTPKVVGEYYYDPKTEQNGGGFFRFYTKRNPYDDFADNFSMYVSAGMKEKVPPTKRAYLDNLLKRYY